MSSSFDSNRYQAALDRGATPAEAWNYAMRIPHPPPPPPPRPAPQGGGHRRGSFPQGASRPPPPPPRPAPQGGGHRRGSFPQGVPHPGPTPHAGVRVRYVPVQDEDFTEQGRARVYGNAGGRRGAGVRREYREGVGHERVYYDEPRRHHHRAHHEDERRHHGARAGDANESRHDHRRRSASPRRREREDRYEYHHPGQAPRPNPFPFPSSRRPEQINAGGDDGRRGHRREYREPPRHYPEYDDNSDNDNPASPATTKDLYAVLGVPATATAAEIKKAFQKLALKHHPDRVPEAQKKEAHERMAEVNEAYEILGDESKRREYDLKRAKGKV